MSVKKPTSDDVVAEVVDRTRAVKALLVAHRGALRRRDRLKIAAVQAAVVDAAAMTVAALDSCLAARGDALAVPGADRGAIVRKAVEYAVRPLRALLRVWHA